MISALCERVGPGEDGSRAGDITGIFTVLVSGTDMDEPVAEQPAEGNDRRVGHQCDLAPTAAAGLARLSSSASIGSTWRSAFSTP